MTRADLLELVFNAIQEVNVGRPSDRQLPKREETSLLGPHARLDSLGLVQLIVEVEQQLAVSGHVLSLTSEKAMSQRHSPFLTIRSLVDYIVQELGASR